MQVFIDTSFFKALVDPRDDFHQKAKQIWTELKTEDASLVTSNFILDETFTLIRIKCGLKRAEELYKILQSIEGGIKIVRVLVSDEKEAWIWFWKQWRDLSYTDCVSFAQLKRLSIERVATFDRHFKKAGFKIEG